MTDDPSQKRIVFLSIKPQWVDAILDGVKRWEYRRQPPAIDPPYSMILYATTPAKEVRAAALVDKTMSDNRATVARATVEQTPHTYGDVQDYFYDQREAHALRIRHVVDVSPPISLSQLRTVRQGFTVPGNFRYVTADKHPDLVATVRYRLPIQHDDHNGLIPPTDHD